jgi:hypothetical protein
MQTEFGRGLPLADPEPTPSLNTFRLQISTADFQDCCISLLLFPPISLASPNSNEYLGFSLKERLPITLAPQFKALNCKQTSFGFHTMRNSST